MLSPKKDRLSGANNVGLLLVDSLARRLLQCVSDSSVFAMENLLEMCHLFGTKETQNCHNRDLKPKLWDETREKLNAGGKY